MKDDRERLRHILDAIERIEKYAARGENAFRQDELIQNWMVRHLQVIGEAARALSQTFREQHSEVPWASIIGMRHVLVHDYFGIDLDIVWRVVSTDLPDLKRNIEDILKSLGEE
jgi:uncharacterized protein with HEPN domain